MIIDEKTIMQPPPAYLSSPPPSQSSSSKLTLSTLPSHILLQILYLTFPQTDLLGENRVSRQRKMLYWLAISLRLVNRALYMACMHVLRSTYLPAYQSLIRPPYSSDPFPLQGPSQDSTSRTFSLQRETATLDLFIALKVREDVWADDSELHLERDESFKDLFDHTQPKSRLEDLVRIYGLRHGVVTLSSNPSPSLPLTSARLTPQPTPPSTTTSFFASLSLRPKPQSREPVSTASASCRITPVSFAHISINFSPRKVGLVLSTAGKRTIVETPRAREEKLESAAKRLVKELRIWLEDNS